MEKVSFVAGATGYTGQALVLALRAIGRPVVAHVRPDSSRLDEWRRRFGEAGAAVDSTPWETEALAETLTRIAPAQVYGLLGTTRARAKALAKAGGDAATETYERVDYGLTVMLLGAAEAAGSEPRFIYLSAAGVNDGAMSAYGRARARVERRLHESSLPWSVARPAFISGTDREDFRAGERFGAVVSDAFLGLAGAVGAKKLRDKWASLDSGTLARGLIALGDDPAMVGRAAGPDWLRRHGAPW